MADVETYVQSYVDYLLLKNYSSGTQQLYLRAIRSFFIYCRPSPNWIAEFPSSSRSYILLRRRSLISWSTVNIEYSSLKLFGEKLLKVDWDVDYLPRPKTKKTLPRILSHREVKCLIESPINFKHRVFITFMYSTGLRVSEAQHVQLSDIDGERLEVFVRQGKGAKDRIVSIPRSLIDLLRAYYKVYRPETYLFEGGITGRPYTYTSIRRIIGGAKKRAGIKKPISAHTLRHCYATHHIENGTDLVYLKEQLGHSKLLTTAQYIHVCRRLRRSLNHPIDRLKVEVYPKTV